MTPHRLSRALPGRANSVRAGFTLVELLIVVVVLAILAAAAIRAFRGQVEDAPLVQLESNLSILREASERYYYQHNNTYPGIKKTDGSEQILSSAGQVAEAFVEQLTRYTDDKGGTSVIKNAQYKLGPYIKKGIPKNPFNGKGGVTADLTNDGLTTMIADDGSAWRFYTQTGVIRPNDEDHKTH